MAAFYGGIEAVQRQLDVNAVSDGALTPLMFAAYRDRLQLATYLLSVGADPKATAKDGRTALSIARKRGAAEVVELLERQLQ